MKHEKQVVTTKVVITCDFCDRECRLSYDPCYGCGKHVCENCDVKWLDNLFSGESDETYYIRVCRNCDKLALSFTDKATESREKHLKLVEGLIKQWRDACKALWEKGE